MASYSFLYQLYLIELNEGFIQLYINRKIDLLQIMIFQLLLANSLSLAIEKGLQTRLQTQTKPPLRKWCLLPVVWYGTTLSNVV